MGFPRYDMEIDFTTREGRAVQGRLIQQAAEEAGLSLETLAREIGCSRALIYQYVSGATLAQPDRVQEVARRTGKPLLYFYGGDAGPCDIHDRIAVLQGLLTAQLGPVDTTSALSTCEQLIALARQAGDVRAEASARLKISGMLLQRGDFARALTALDELALVLQQQQLPAHQQGADQNRGYALLALGRVEEAEEMFRRVVAAGDWTARWQGTVSLAAVAEYRGQYCRALALLDEVLALAPDAPTASAGSTLRLYVAGNLANIHLACGDFALAARATEEAGDLAVQLSNHDQYIESLLTRGVCERMSGLLAASRQTLETAARWTRLAEDKGREALASAELAATLVEAGRYEEARLLGKEALQQGIATSSCRAELAAQMALAGAYLRAGMPQDARYHAVQGWEISIHLGQPCAQAAALVILGETHRARGDREEARRAFSPAYDLADGIGARVPAVQAGLGLAWLGEGMDLARLLAQARKVAAPALLWSVLLASGEHAEASLALDAAEQYYREAVAVIETVRRTLVEEPSGDTYLEYRRAWDPYLRLIRLYQLRGKTELAADLLVQAAWPPLEALQEDVR